MVLPWMTLLRGLFTYVNNVLVDSGRALALNFIGSGITASYNPDTGIVDVDLSSLSSGGSGGGGGFPYTFDDSTSTLGDPGSGNFRFNNAVSASVTEIAVADTNSDGADIGTFLLAADDSTTTDDRGTIIVRRVSDPTIFAIFKINNASNDAGAWVRFAVVCTASGGAFADGYACSVEFARTGSAGGQGIQGIQGDQGDPGDPGAPGATGSNTGATYLYDTSTSVNTDPGAGNFRLNNATHSSATAMAVADTDDNANNLELYLLAQDGSTNTSNRCQIVIRSKTTPATFRIYNVTGASTDSAGWVQFAITYVTGGGSLSASEECDFQFARTGDKGDSATTAVASVITESTTARTLVIGDAEGYIRYTNASAVAVTVPDNASVAFPVGTTVTHRQAGAGQVTFAPAGGVTINQPSSTKLKTQKTGAVVYQTKVAADAWDIYGDLLCVIGVELTDANQTLAVAGGDDYAQYVDLTANRSKQLSLTGATDGRVITIRRYTTAAFTLTINNSLGAALYQFASGETGVVTLRYAASVGEWLLSGYKDLI